MSIEYIIAIIINIIATVLNVALTFRFNRKKNERDHY